MADVAANVVARPESGWKESRAGQNWRAGNYQQTGGSVLMSRGGSILVSAEDPGVLSSAGVASRAPGGAELALELRRKPA